VSEATSRVADATAAVAGGVVGAAVEGVIGGIQGAANRIRDGRRKGSQSVAGRQGARGHWRHRRYSGSRQRNTRRVEHRQSIPPAAALTFGIAHGGRAS
jgi:hypothetical protein